MLGKMGPAVDAAGIRVSPSRIAGKSRHPFGVE